MVAYLHPRPRDIYYNYWALVSDKAKNMQSTSANQTTSTHQLNRQTFVDQDALNLTESTPSLTIASTHFSASQHENEEDMMSHTSAYSYRTEADASRFLHEVEGRVSTRLDRLMG